MDSLVKVLESVMFARDPYTVTHQWRVAQISSAIAGEIGLKKKQTRNLMMAARLHDFGKISIPVGILSRPGNLSGLERAMIKRHPTTGYDLLKHLPLPAATLMAIMQHHERTNGSGYPFGLSGEAILLEARILGLADVVEAMAFRRPYRPSLGIEMALEEISQQRGFLYDPLVVDAFRGLYFKNMFGNFFAVKVFRDAA
jgi:HD-GYP domain-containing protein (c-di-GMP phosphodiesterase class II)